MRTEDMIVDEHGNVHAPSHELRCCWHAWKVIGPHELRVFLPADHCTDMCGVIHVAKSLMPEVSLIWTVAGEMLDTFYERRGEKWRAVLEGKSSEWCEC